jgi:hypothetical protein
MNALPALARRWATWLYALALEVWSYALAQTHPTRHAAG